MLFNETFEKKDLLLLATKLTEKIPDACKSKEQYQSFIKRKNTKSVKQSKIITQQPKSFENPNIVDIRLVIIEHSNTFHKLSETIIQTDNIVQVSSNSSLYSDTEKLKIFKTKKFKSIKTSPKIL